MKPKQLVPFEIVLSRDYGLVMVQCVFRMGIGQVVDYVITPLNMLGTRITVYACNLRRITWWDKIMRFFTGEYKF